MIIKTVLDRFSQLLITNYFVGGSLTNASPDHLENNEDSFVEDKIRAKKQFSFHDESGDNPMNDNFSNDHTYQVDDNVSSYYILS